MNLKELSAKLGLSQTTISRALNGYPEVSEATRRRVIEAADTYNYRPSTKAKALATGRSMAIGHVIPVSTTHEIVNPIFSDFIAGAGEIYAANGYDLLMSVVSDDEEAKAYRDLAAKASVDGVIIHSPRRHEPRISLLQETGLPFVVHGRASEEESDYCWVDVNNRRAFHRAAEFLMDLGHRRIALVNGNEEMDFAARRRDGYVHALEERDLPVDESLMRSDDMTEVYGYTAARNLLASSDRPTAFLVSSIITSIGVRRAAEEAGLKLGRDVSLITYDDELSYLGNGGDEPIFTALRSSVREAGRRSAEMLLERINDPDKPATKLMLDAQLVVGQTTGPAEMTPQQVKAG